MQFRVPFSRLPDRLLVVHTAVAAHYWKIVEIETQRVTAEYERVRYSGVQHCRHMERLVAQDEIWCDFADFLLALQIDLAYERIAGCYFPGVHHLIERTHRQCLLEAVDYEVHSLHVLLFVRFEQAE